MAEPKKTAVAHAINALPNASPGHARLGPSGAKKWLSCPGSIVLEAQFPNTSSSYADEGTACHDVGARCLINNLRASAFIGEYVCVSHESEPRRTVEFTPELAELTQTYVDNVNAMLRPDSVAWVETKVETSDWLGVPNQFGTADLAVLNPYQGEGAQPGDLELEIHDAKFGRTPVPVTTPQLPLYALGFISALLSGKPPAPIDRPQRKPRSIIDTTSEDRDEDDIA